MIILKIAFGALSAFILMGQIDSILNEYLEDEYKEARQHQTTMSLLNGNYDFEYARQEGGNPEEIRQTQEMI